MSRIHEALQKARNQQGTPALNLPNADEIIEAGTSWTAPDASTTADFEPLETPRPSPVSDLLERCAVQTWNPDTTELVFMSENPNGPGQEQFRTLRSRLYQLRTASPLGVIVVSSAIPGEGKSFVSANLALSFALQSGRRALLIDADLRRFEGVTVLLGASRAPGLAEYLAGEQELDKVLQRGGIENLYLISCGKHVQRPAELIGDHRFAILLERLRPMFDWIIIDTPPVLPIADARVVANLSDGVILVVNAESTQAHLAKRAASEFGQHNLLGVVLNRTKDVSASYYSDYGYGYHKEKGA